ncbi:hypothetical protein CEXT_447231 [Caerostris extrusa]|uniref:Uncharacterized protein n=1 Tax=Caerostris extrusa TaxID=172846 RepID=A0AAV4NUK7_CAEEX|nr:hypothetical protein CEXT_447231 [Caerostris extrusa]
MQPAFKVFPVSHMSTLRHAQARRCTKRPDWNTDKKCSINFCLYRLRLTALLYHTPWNVGICSPKPEKHASSPLQPGSFGSSTNQEAPRFLRWKFFPSTRSHTRIHSAIHLLVGVASIDENRESNNRLREDGRYDGWGGFQRFVLMIGENQYERDSSLRETETSLIVST